jgi:hypothetical protein
MAAGSGQPTVAGELAVRWERRDDVLTMWLIGALDQVRAMASLGTSAMA